MSQLYPVAGCRIYIGPAMNLPDDDLTKADFDGIVWTEIKGWSQMGAFGDTAALITSSLINNGRDVKQKGTRNAGQMQNVFAVKPEDEGQLALIAAETSPANFPFRLVLNDTPVVAETFAATISQASPGVLTKVAHGLEVGDAVVLSTSGSLPTGLTAGTQYFVKTTPDADTFTLATTPGGTAINTTSAGSGTHTVALVPAASERLFAALVMSAQEAGGEANTTRNLTATLELNSNIVRVPAYGGA